MQEKRYNEAKKEIRSVLLTYRESVTLEEFLRCYKDLLGERLPSRALGFSSDVVFLQSMPDVVSVCIDANGKIHLSGIADAKSEHIQKLVSKQRKSKRNELNKLSKRQPVKRLPDTSFNIKELKPFLPGTLRAEILQLMSMYQNGVTFTAFALAYHRKFNKYLPLIKGLDSLEGIIKLIPELEIKNENKEKKICLRNFRETYGAEINSSVSQVKEDDVEVLKVKDSFNIHKSGIADDILQSFRLILQKCPEGILDVHFPPLYENVTGRSFDLHSLGYNSIAELVDALPNIFKRVLNPNGDRNWIILPAEASIKHTLKVQNSPFPSHGKLSHPKSQEGIPADAASPILQYIQPIIPEYVDLNEYVPVFVSSIVNPSLFWFQLQTDKAIENFDMFEKDMGFFYESYGKVKYKMNDGDIAIGATCIVLCPGDKQWYRAVIKSLPSIHLVNVLYVDYGGRENIPRCNLFYVRSKYHDYSACAFKCQLAGLKPPHNASTWDIQAQRRFIQLCDSGILMAYLKPVDKDTYSVYLCDTSGETDIHLNDTLINEGYAEICYESQFDVNSIYHANNSDQIVIPNGFKIDSESELSSGSDQLALQSDKNCLIPGSEVSPVNRKLFVSPEKQYNGIKSNVSSCEKTQGSKRYIKMLQLCEDKKIHFINLENKLYMSCGDLSYLLWSGKDSSFLIERLKYKEVDAPFLKLSKENQPELFKQCIWYKIPEFENLESDNSSLILYPLEWAFNILNIFGHPSVCLRLAIQNEIKTFDPFDPIWKRFCNESRDLDDIEKEMEEKLGKLCLYDLKAKSEAFKIKRLKLLRTENASVNKEIKRIEKLQNFIERRIKQIEALCAQYSNCL